MGGKVGRWNRGRVSRKSKDGREKEELKRRIAEQWRRRVKVDNRKKRQEKAKGGRRRGNKKENEE